MKRKSRGQTLVEFALVFPLIVVFLFGIIEMGYYVFAWSEFQFGARRGAEQASKLQPREIRAPDEYRLNTMYIGSDPCLKVIQQATARSGAFNGVTSIGAGDIYLTFHNGTTDIVNRTDAASKSIGRIVQVRVEKRLEPLTPLAGWITRDGGYTFNAVSRRTIIANGPTYPLIGENGEDFNRCVYEN